MIERKIKDTIRDIKNFPIEGIIFKDIMPLLQNPMLCKDIIDLFAERMKDIKIDAVAGIESRGFFWGPGIAQKLQVPFIAVRKQGKLPGDTMSYTYDLEYGSATIEIQKGLIKPGQQIMIHDDLLATGGTAYAAGELIKKLHGKIAGFSFLIHLAFLNGEEQLLNQSKNVINLATYK